MILADTGALYALLDQNDAHHTAAKQFFTKTARSQLFAITYPILTESAILIEARLGEFYAHQLIKFTSSNIFVMLELTSEDLAHCVRIQEQYEQAKFGFVDSSTLAVCERHKIANVFTFDLRHFTIYKPRFAKRLSLLPHH